MTTKATSNCSQADDAYGAVGSLPSATGHWANVFMVNDGGQYPICTLTWDLAFNNYTTAGYTHGTGTARTVTDYLHYILQPTGGQRPLR